MIPIIPWSSSCWNPVPLLLQGWEGHYQICIWKLQIVSDLHTETSFQVIDVYYVKWLLSKPDYLKYWVIIVSLLASWKDSPILSLRNFILSSAGLLSDAFPTSIDTWPYDVSSLASGCGYRDLFSKTDPVLQTWSKFTWS